MRDPLDAWFAEVADAPVPPRVARFDPGAAEAMRVARVGGLVAGAAVALWTALAPVSPGPATGAGFVLGREVAEVGR